MAPFIPNLGTRWSDTWTVKHFALEGISWFISGRLVVTG